MKTGNDNSLSKREHSLGGIHMRAYALQPAVCCDSCLQSVHHQSPEDPRLSPPPRGHFLSFDISEAGYALHQGRIGVVQPVLGWLEGGVWPHEKDGGGSHSPSQTAGGTYVMPLSRSASPVHVRSPRLQHSLGEVWIVEAISGALHPVQPTFYTDQ
jgi:hypothetical protein